ncbi:Pet494p NDAI_0K02380 [Naumovozyma dairenensis CBS 421]|uniref:Uncharacterized protein n=1 Tax=Naumovozyma dairenensis (strain ATCC 10597 / BCRC 20456 / CBS 421 / NBRC 0211 / NRRL Y-12639) TaxID=1071378 RepID=G0WI18_NAUDC|nr:hypothetical protein NDAI_0K02380 [Naumovozyma dairenensis CBS 421]CCD27429.1 hypothetical protein NDAI_0K02380 [Naumovozyma dairenensis CBS 421]
MYYQAHHQYRHHYRHYFYDYYYKSLKRIWSRLYHHPTSIRRAPTIRTNRSSGGLLLNNGKIFNPNSSASSGSPYFFSLTGKTLWKYFKTPGNLLFVTTNIVAFMGVVTYNTIIMAEQERAIQEQNLIESFNYRINNNNNTTGDIMKPRDDGIIEVSPEDEIDKILSKKNKSTTLSTNEKEALSKTKSIEKEEEEDTPLTTYSAASVKLDKKVPCKDYNSAAIEMSLFHMFYAYELYKNVLLKKGSSSSSSAPSTEGRSGKPTSWEKEIKLLKKMFYNVESTETSENTERKAKRLSPIIGLFYPLWRKEFQDIVTDFDKLQYFALPNWENYSKDLRRICYLLHDSKESITKLDTFHDFYNQVYSFDIKKLLSFWIYDNYKLLKSRNVTSNYNESFYQTLLKDNNSDPYTFIKYSSIILNPENPRKDLFFPKRSIALTDGHRHNNNNKTVSVPTISLETFKTVLKGFISLSKKEDKKYSQPVTALLKILKTNCILDNSKSGTKVRILLPTNEQQGMEQRATMMLDRSEENEKCYRILSKDEELVRALDDLSKWIP